MNSNNVPHDHEAELNRRQNRWGKTPVEETSQGHGRDWEPADTSPMPDVENYDDDEEAVHAAWEAEAVQQAELDGSVSQKLSVDDAQVVGGVAQISRKAVYLAGGLAVGVVLLLIGMEIFGEPTDVSELEASAQVVAGNQANSTVEDMWGERQREKARAEKPEQQEELGKQLQEAERLQKDLEEKTLEGHPSSPEVSNTGRPADDPWVQARQQARQRSAQTHFQQSSSARGAKLLAIKPMAPMQSNPKREVAAFDSRREAAVAAPAAASQEQQASPNEVFFNKGAQAGPVNFKRLQGSAGEYVVQAGTMLPLVLETGVNSDLPGMLKARFMGPVYDTVTGKHLLIPVGSVVLGKYNASQTYGQSRLQVAWNRLILPNGKSIDLGNIAGIGLDGNSGYADQVDEHWGRILGAVTLSSVMSVGAGVAAGPRSQFESTPRQAALGGLAQDLNETGQEITRRQLNIQPTITIRPGMKVSAFVQQDLILEPYER